jgi:hypothetical protein
VARVFMAATFQPKAWSPVTGACDTRKCAPPGPCQRLPAMTSLPASQPTPAGSTRGRPPSSVSTASESRDCADPVENRARIWPR